MIRLRGVAVHNLKQVDLDLPHRRLIAFCGVSGSGKTSLALDTLYTEGQRRYVESFSTYTRQFLEQLDKPAAESIEGIPPSVAVARKNVSRSSRATVGSSTQVNEHLQLLLRGIGEVICYECGERVERDSAESAADELLRLPSGTRVMLGFASQRGKERNAEEWLGDLAALGYRRCVLAGRPRRLAPELAARLAELKEIEVVVDRVTAHRKGRRGCAIRWRARWRRDAGRRWLGLKTMERRQKGVGSLLRLDDFNLLKRIASRKRLPTPCDTLDGRAWLKRRFSRRLRCERAASSTPTSNRNCSTTTTRSAPARPARGSAISSTSTCSGSSRCREIAARGGDRAVEHAGVCPRAGRTAGAGAEAWHPGRRAVPRVNDEQLRLIREGVPEKSSAGSTAFSTGSNGGSTRCTFASF